MKNPLPTYEQIGVFWIRSDRIAVAMRGRSRGPAGEIPQDVVDRLFSPPDVAEAQTYED